MVVVQVATAVDMLAALEARMEALRKQVLAAARQRASLKAVLRHLPLAPMTRRPAT